MKLPRSLGLLPTIQGSFILLSMKIDQAAIVNNKRLGPVLKFIQGVGRDFRLFSQK